MCESANAATEGLSMPQGHALLRQLVRPRLPHDLHDYILEGICKALDGLHVVSIVKTCGGKTSYFYGYVIALQELAKVDQSHPLKSRLLCEFPERPVMVIVYPTKGLEEEMVRIILPSCISAYLVWII